jgi:hypothetical protein
MSSDDVDQEHAEDPLHDERDIAPVLEGWPLDLGTVTARRTTGSDGAELIQLRIPMGLLQLNPEGRPDGIRLEGHSSALAWLRDLVEHKSAVTKEQWYELDREIMQYYHRRIALLSIAESERREGLQKRAATDYARIVSDADHNLAIMDFIKQHNDDQEFIETHEQYRAFVLGHRALAAAYYWLCREEPEEALSATQGGMERLRRSYEERGDTDVMQRDQTATRLVRLAEQIRKEHAIARTLHEDLSEAVEKEDFEKAAQVRDAIHRRMTRLKAPFKP